MASSAAAAAGDADAPPAPAAPAPPPPPGSSSSAAAGAGERPPTDAPYRSAALPVAARVADLLPRMSAAETLAQLVQPMASTRAVLAAYGATGVGGVALEDLAGGGDFPSPWAALNALQGALLNGSRLGIPASVFTEGLHGGMFYGTIFPAPVNLGNTFDAPLLRAVGAAIAAEARLGGAERVFAPELQVVTDARFGRFYESFSESPFLVSALGAQMTLGIQGAAAAPDAYLGNLR